MNIMIWIVAGAAAGWASFAYLKFSEGRGMVISLIVGAAGGMIGGKLLAPMLGATASAAGDFSAMALLVALATAAALLFVGDRIHERFGV